jgi:hypothetical protein
VKPADVADADDPENKSAVTDDGSGCAAIVHTGDAAESCADVAENKSTGTVVTK